MAKRVLAYTHKMRSNLFDDDYTLYENGSVLHEYDRNIHSFNLKEELIVNNLSPEIKARLYDAASDENKERVKEILKMY